MHRSVSVIIPTYNRAALIPFAIDSALGQSHRPLEIIVIDDGSKDDTETVCRRYGDAVTYVRQANGGVSRARNHGVSLARGDIVAFLDSDDTWRPDKLAIQLSAMAATGARWSITDATRIDGNGEPVAGAQGFPSIFPVFSQLKRTPEEHFGRCLKTVSILGAPHVQVFAGDLSEIIFLGNVGLPASLVIEKKLFDEVGAFDPELRLAEETDLVQRLSLAAPVAVVNARLAGYRVGLGGSLVSAGNLLTLVDNATSISTRNFRRIQSPSAEVRKTFQLGIRLLAAKRAYFCLATGDYKGVRRSVPTAMKGFDRLSLRAAGTGLATIIPHAALTRLARLARRAK